MENVLRDSRKQQKMFKYNNHAKQRISALTSASGSKVICAYTSSVSGSAYMTNMNVTIE